MNPNWVSPDKTMNTLRTPTCLLLNERKEFEAFGCEAEKKYLDLMKENKHTKHYYFQRYKTKLYGEIVSYRNVLFKYQWKVGQQ